MGSSPSAPATRPDIRRVLHIGAHKTASTHLQLCLQRAESALSAHGVAVFTPRRLRAPDLLLQDYVTRPPEDEGRAEHGARLRAAFATGARRLVISEENILGNAHAQELMQSAQFYPRAEQVVPRVLELLPPGPRVLALAVREPASFIVSAYSQRLMSGASDSFDQFLNGLNPLSLSWFDLVVRLRRAAPFAQIIVWRYEDYPAIAPSVLAELLGPQPAAAVQMEASVEHPGLSAQAHLAVMAEAETLRALDPDTARARIRALRDLHPKGPDAAPFDPFLPSFKARAAQAYHEDVARLAEMRGVRLLERDGVE